MPNTRLLAAIFGTMAAAFAAYSLYFNIGGVTTVARARINKAVGNRLPDVLFEDERGSGVHLGTILEKASRNWVVPVYYQCPGPCTLVIETVLDRVSADVSLRDQLGKNFQIIFFSFDPKEDHVLADAKRTASLSRRLGLSDKGIRFLSGGGSSADLVCRSLHFQYRWLANKSMYSHDLKIFEVDSRSTITREISRSDLSRTNLNAGAERSSLDARPLSKESI